MGFVHLWELWLTYNIAISEKDKFDLHVYFSLTSIMRNLKTCPPFSCHKFIFCPHAIIPPCNLICQIYQRKKKENKERGRQKKKIIVFCLFPLYDVKSRYLWHSPSHIVFFCGCCLCCLLSTAKKGHNWVLASDDPDILHLFF